jgi:uncharacterized protein involved in exopolysaccharide biosynthesis
LRRLPSILSERDRDVIMKRTSPTSLYRADTIDLIAVWLVLWRHKFLVILVSSLCVATAAVLAMTATPIYRADVVVIPTRDSGVGDAASLAGRLGGLASLAGINVGASGGAGADALAVLRSRFLIETFIERKGLLSELSSNTAETPSLWLSVDRFQRTVVSIVTNNERGTTTIAVSWRDPSVAAKWANEFVALANDLIRSKALEDASRNIEYLNKQLEQTNLVELRRVLYNLIEAETQRVMLANARLEYAFTIVDPAVAPETRISPRRTLMVLTGGALGGVLGVILALIVNAIRLHREQDAGSSVGAHS